MAYLKRSGREEPVAHGRGNKPEAMVLRMPRPFQVMRPRSRIRCEGGSQEADCPRAMPPSEYRWEGRLPCYPGHDPDRRS
jgi:hypothetical protein